MLVSDSKISAHDRVPSRHLGQTCPFNPPSNSAKELLSLTYENSETDLAKVLASLIALCGPDLDSLSSGSTWPPLWRKRSFLSPLGTWLSYTVLKLCCCLSGHQNQLLCHLLHYCAQPPSPLSLMRLLACTSNNLFLGFFHATAQTPFSPNELLKLTWDKPDPDTMNPLNMGDCYFMTGQSCVTGTS